MQITPGLDIIDDPNVQVLEIIMNDVRNLKILNIYNEKNQNVGEDQHIIDRIIPKLSFNANDKLINCGDFNAHHEWWNSNVRNPVRSTNLIQWVKQLDCDLLNIPNHFGNSKSVIDLTFASRNIENSIVNWNVDNNATIGSDHEVINFEILTSIENFTNRATSISQKYNIAKAN